MLLLFLVITSLSLGKTRQKQSQQSEEQPTPHGANPPRARTQQVSKTKTSPPLPPEVSPPDSPPPSSSSSSPAVPFTSMKTRTPAASTKTIPRPSSSADVGTAAHPQVEHTQKSGQEGSRRKPKTQQVNLLLSAIEPLRQQV